MKKILKKVGLILILMCLLTVSCFQFSYAKDTVDSIISGADDFISSGLSSDINQEELKETSDFLYNLLLGVGIIVAVIVGVIIGIKYMIGSVDEKAELKQTLFAYLVGCVVVFGAFGIWKIAVSVLQAI